MNRDRWTKTGKRVDLSGVSKLIIDIDRSGILEELAEAGAGVGKAPTRGLDPELIERLLNTLVLMFVHKCGGEFFLTAKNRRNENSLCLHIILKICLDIEKNRRHGVDRIVTLPRVTTSSSSSYA